MPKCFCGVTACFSHKGEIAKWCVRHKTEQMINIVDVLCLECDKRAMVNLPGKTGGIYCMTHAKEGMVNVKSKRCAFVYADGLPCYTTPIYNIDGEHKGKYCILHKSSEMINVIGKRCEVEACRYIAQFNMAGEKKGKYCSQHKEDGMIDVKHRRCEFEGCSQLPSFKYPTDTSCRFCSIHKLEGMINGKHALCLFEGCKTVAGYTVVGSKTAQYCSSHKLDGMIDLKHALCRSEWCENYANTKYEKYCIHCYIHLFPDNTIVRNYKTKEKSVVDFVLAQFGNMDWIADKRVQNGCSRRRPDLFLELGSHVLIIEVDENQHIDYDCSCENKRLMEISRDIGHRPLIFIRFNPDGYIDNNEHKIKTCWIPNKQNGILYVPKTKICEWNHRLSILQKQIEYWVETKPDKMLEIIQLFYDGMIPT